MFENTFEPSESFLAKWFSPGEPVLVARWVFLRALGAIFFSAFYSLYFQIHGLIGPHGILAADEYLQMARRAAGAKAYWLAPTLLWLNASDRALDALVWIGLIASVAIMIDIAPRTAIAIAGLCFLSFIGAAQDFASYQSDGMLLEAAFLSLFFAPRGLRPGLGRAHPPTRASTWLLRWEWFRIYFESGLVKLISGEPQWRNLTAMDKYYENGPLPSWPGWYVQHWPHSFHAASAALTLIVELFVVWLIFFGPRARLLAFVLTTPLQIGIILTANYAFLNYLVLFMGVLIVEVRFVRRPSGARAPSPARPSIVQAIILPIHFVTTSVMFLFPH
ncbi:MAG: lipase maturation factor family protein, partial [Thermoanaerobaculia bacterium]